MWKQIFTPKNIAIALSLGTAALIITSFFNEHEKRKLNQRYEQMIEQGEKANEKVSRVLKDSREVLDRLRSRLDKQEN